MLYHYTSISTLEKILESKKIRFNRLDRVNDKTESEFFSGINLAKYIFISCWTNQDENLPQWYMYGNECKDVCLKMPEEMFKQKHVLNQIHNGVSVGNLKSLFYPNELMTSAYMILPICNEWSQFYQPITYVDNIKTIKKDLATVTKNSDSTTISLPTTELKKASSYKNKSWEFEKESRFVLYILPFERQSDSSLSDEQKNILGLRCAVNSMLNNIPPKIEYFDVELDENVLNNIEIILGPLCSEKDMIRVNDILHKSSKNYKLNRSKFTGQIRNPERD